MRGLAVFVLCLGLLAPALAQQDKKTNDLKPADPDTGESTVEETTLGLLPNPLEKQGIKFALTYIGEVLGNPTGGAKQSAIYEDRINFAVDADLHKLLGLNGLAFHGNIFRIDGGGLSRGALFNLLDVSGIEALPTTRLYEAWFERSGTARKSRCGQASLLPTPNSPPLNIPTCSPTPRSAGPGSSPPTCQAADRRRRSLPWAPVSART
jgi:porin